MKSGKQDPKSFEKYLDSKRLFTHIIRYGKELPLADVALYLQEYSGDKVRTDGNKKKGFSYLKSHYSET